MKIEIDLREVGFYVGFFLASQLIMQPLFWLFGAYD